VEVDRSKTTTSPQIHTQCPEKKIEILGVDYVFYNCGKIQKRMTLDQCKIKINKVKCKNMKYYSHIQKHVKQSYY